MPEYTIINRDGSRYSTPNPLSHQALATAVSGRALRVRGATKGRRANSYKVARRAGLSCTTLRDGKTLIVWMDRS